MFDKIRAKILKISGMSAFYARYHFYLDCMRVDDMQAFEDEEQQKSRIILSATRQASIERAPDHLSSVSTQSLLALFD